MCNKESFFPTTVLMSDTTSESRTTTTTNLLPLLVGKDGHYCTHVRVYKMMTIKKNFLISRYNITRDLFKKKTKKKYTIKVSAIPGVHELSQSVVIYSNMCTVKNMIISMNQTSRVYSIL